MSSEPIPPAVNGASPRRSRGRIQSPNGGRLLPAAIAIALTTAVMLLPNETYSPSPIPLDTHDPLDMPGLVEREGLALENFNFQLFSPYFSRQGLSLIRSAQVGHGTEQERQKVDDALTALESMLTLDPSSSDFDEAFQEFLRSGLVSNRIVRASNSSNPNEIAYLLLTLNNVLLATGGASLDPSHPIIDPDAGAFAPAPLSVAPNTSSSTTMQSSGQTPTASATTSSPAPPAL